MGYNLRVDLLSRYPILTDQIDRAELSKILSALDDVLQRKVPGDVVEFGCYVGTTSLFLRRLLVSKGSRKQLHVYDSFAGLPPKTTPDLSPAGEQFRAGELRASKQELIKHFRQAGLALPIIHRAWFSDLVPGDIPCTVAFAFLDGDFYESIWDSLELVWPRLNEGAVVVVDDYQSEALPGARRAVDEWLRIHPAQLQVASSLAILRGF